MLALLGYPFLLEPWVADAHAGAGAGRPATCVFVAAVRGGRHGSALRRAAGDRRAAHGDAAPTRRRRASRRPTRRAPGAVVRARRDRLAAAARGDPTTSRRTSPRCRCCGSCRSTIYLLTFILCFDGTRLVPPRALPRVLAAGARRDGMDARRPEAHARARDPDRRVLRRALPRLHVLPRRARAAEARAALPDALLPDGLAGRRGRLGAGGHRRAAGAAGLLRARVGLVVCARCCSLWQVRRAPSGLRRARRRRAADRRSGCAVWAINEFYDDTIVATRNFYGVLRVQDSSGETTEPPPLADPRHDPARQAVPGAGLARASRRRYYTPTSGIGRAARSAASDA